MSDLKRYWASWWSGRYADEGCTQHPFKLFVSGFRDRADGRDEESCILWIAAPSEDAARDHIKPYFPDYQERFINEWGIDDTPNDRFPGMELYVFPDTAGGQP